VCVWCLLLQERDLWLADLKDANRSILQELRTLNTQNPQVAVAELLQQYDMKLPTGSGSGSSGVSPAGSASSVKSAGSAKSGSINGRGPAIRTMQLQQA
jgi:hypothetical protein